METGLRRLRYFQCLSTELSFRRAAAKLGLTQPALSRAIALLEEDIGTPLFKRSNRQVELTLAGEAFAVGCERVLTALDGVIDQALRVADGREGTLVVGYTDTAIAGLLPDIIQSFRVAAPRIHLRLIQTYTKQQIVSLEDGSLDIGFLTGPVEPGHFQAIDIQSDRMMVILPRGHDLAARSAVSLSDLATLPFVLGDLDRWGAYHAHLFRQCEKAGFRPEIVQTAPESRALIGLVSCGMGVSVQAESLVEHGDARVVRKPLTDVLEKVTTQAAWNTRFQKPARSRMIDHLAGYVKSDADRREISNRSCSPLVTPAQAP